MKSKDEMEKATILNMEGGADPSARHVMVDAGYEDEINLLDLWLVLSKHRYVILIVALACLILGGGYAMTRPVLYEYGAALQIGSMSAGAGTEKKHIETTENLLAKLTEGYIPFVLYEYLKENPEVKSAPGIKARVPKKSDLIVIESKGTDEDSAVHLSLISQVVAQVKKDHQPQMDMTRSQFEFSLKQEKLRLSELQNPVTLKEKQKSLEMDLLKAQIALDNLKDVRLTRVVKQELETQKKSQQNKLSALGDEAEMLLSERKRLDDVDRLLEKQIAELSATLNNELKNRNISENNVSSGEGAMTLLLIDNQVQGNRNRLAKLEERLNIGQQSLREKLDNQSKENKRQAEYYKTLIADTNRQLAKLDIDNGNKQQTIAAEVSSLKLKLEKLQLAHENEILNQQQKIDDLSYKLNGISDTQTLTDPMQSFEPVSSKKKLIVILSLFVGLFVGVFVAFFLEFLSKVKEKEQQA